jgi:tetratricopeptide (TPR) repeat protein
MSHTIGQVKQQQQQSNSHSTETIDNSSESGDKSSPSPPALTDGDYEFLFNQLLQGVAHGWHQQRVEKFFIQLGDRGNPEDWISWLERFGSKILTQHLASREQLAILMIRLGEITQSSPKIKKMGATSYHIGRQLLSQHQNLVSQSVGAKASPAEEVAWEYDGPDLANKSELVIDQEITPPENLSQEVSTVEVSPAAKKDVVLKTEELVADELVNYPAEKAPETSNSDNTIPVPSLESELTTQSELAPEKPELSNLTSSELLSLIQQDEELAQQISRKLNISLSNEPELSQSAIAKTDNSDTIKVEPNTPNSSPFELVESWFNLGLKQASAGEFEAAVNSWEQALQLNSNLSEAWHNRGSALGRLGKYEPAIESFEKALAIAPNNYQAWNDRAHALYQLQRWQEAVASWNQAIEIMPGHHLFWYNRGCALEQLKRFDESIASYEKALEIKPDFQPARARYINLIADNPQSN